MTTGEKITEAMIPSFELDVDDAVQINARAALRASNRGMSAEDIYLIFGLSQEELTPYRSTWSLVSKLEHA